MQKGDNDMKLLAIDTSTLVMSVAVLEADKVLGEVTTNLHKNHSVRLMPTVHQLMQELDLTPDQLEAVAVAKGPGSYTGVRIGFTTAKTIAWSCGIPLIPISSLAVLAMNGSRFGGGVVPLFDARRNRIYTGLYRGKDGQVELMKEDRVMDLDGWLEELKEQGPLLFLGDDVRLFQTTIQQVLGENAKFGQPGENIPRAAHLGRLALDQVDRESSAQDAAPDYLQLTEAEAKWLKTQKNGVKRDGSFPH